MHTRFPFVASALLAAAPAAGNPSQAASFLSWADAQQAPEPVPELARNYRFSADVFREVAQVVRERPGIVEVESIGSTTDLRPIWAFHVVDPTVPVERGVLVFANLHAMEWISTEVATAFLLEMAANPIAGTRITVIPVLNPDGREKVEADLRSGTLRYRRGNEKNVDLNRDFPVHRDARAIWRHVIPGYYATSGEPLSQPETQALDALAGRECYARAVSLHAFGGFLYHPWTGRWEPAPDHAQFVELGRVMERAQGARAYHTKQLSHWGFFFRAQGSEIDHLYGTYGTRAFLVELTRSGIQPGKPKTWKNYFRWYNPVDPAPTVERMVRALRAFALHPPLPGEPDGPPCAGPAASSSP